MIHNRDRYFIFASAFLRSCAISLSGVIVALYLATRGFDLWLVGFTISLGLIGAAFGTFAITFISHRFSYKSTLFTLAMLMAVGGLVFSFAANSIVLIAGAFVGMVNGMGRDRGPATTIEQAILPKTTTSAERTKVFAWYNVVVDTGNAVGALLGVVAAFSYQWTWLLYTVLCVLSGILILRVSKGIEEANVVTNFKFSPASKKIVIKFAALSGFDSLAGGFLTTALISFWFFKRFGVGEWFLGPLFFVARIANGLSHLGAAWLAKRIGLVKTMVYTHIPSSILLMTIPFMPNLFFAAVLFVLRESLVEMDVPTRQSYLAAVVKEEERVRAMGVTNLTRGVAWGVAPAFAGSLMAGASFSIPLFIGPGLKIIYDILLYREFRKIKPPEEITA